MSYEIVKAATIKKDVQEVWFTSYSNNVTPKIPERWESKGLTKKLREEGEEAVHKTILYLYWAGEFQPGAYNTYHKAAKLFSVLHPEITYQSIGSVTDEEIWFCPLEDLPKYLNHEDRRVKDYAQRRLKGETFTRGKDIPVVTMTRDELEQHLYDIYKNYRKRKKGEFVIGTGDQFVAGTCGKRRYYVTWNIESAHVFPSWEDAAVYCKRYGFNTDNVMDKNNPEEKVSSGIQKILFTTH
jgi:hypothetical protein